VRVALVCALAIMWLTFALATRWAHVDGSINGPKRPFFVIALLAASVFAIPALRDRQPDRGMSRAAARVLAVSGLVFLGYCFLCWFPLSTWRQIPFLDDWPIRYQGAHDMMRRGRAPRRGSSVTTRSWCSARAAPPTPAR
jgi:hypothetical protein